MLAVHRHPSCGALCHNADSPRPLLNTVLVTVLVFVLVVALLLALVLVLELIPVLALVMVLIQEQQERRDLLLSLNLRVY